MANQVTHGAQSVALISGKSPEEGGFTFHGYSKMGKAQIIRGCVRYYGVGKVECCDEHGAPLHDQHAHVVSGYKVDAVADQVIMAWGQKDSRWYRFIGVLTAVHVPTAKTACQAESSVVTPAPDSRPSISEQPGVIRKRAKALNSFEEEVKRIGLIRAAGLDLDLRMSLIPRLVGESRSGLYAKMAMNPPQFPLPAKRGRSSFWRLSVIDAYREGKWVPHADEGSPKGCV